VSGVFRGKKKIGSNLGAVKPESRLLRLLRLDAGFQVSLANVDRKYQEAAYDQSQKGIHNAMLEAEYQKARANMTMQRGARTFC
jgi:hypothetical protein